MSNIYLIFGKSVGDRTHTYDVPKLFKMLEFFAEKLPFLEIFLDPSLKFLHISIWKLW